MRSIVAIIAVSTLGLLLTRPALASVEARSGLPTGLHVGVGLTGASADLALGPISLGGAVTSSYMGTGNFGTALNPSARLVWTVRGGDGLSAGLVAAGTSMLGYPPPTPVNTQDPSTYKSPQPVRTLIGDVGLAVSYRYDFPYFFGRPLPITFSPTVTFMLDENGNVKFGPQTNLEVALRFTPEAELTVGGGTAVGLRFKL
ncbi:MAG TPA: hypothetical protein V6D05_15250 [Stenomitos sp.]